MDAEVKLSAGMGQRQVAGNCSGAMQQKAGDEDAEQMAVRPGGSAVRECVGDGDGAGGSGLAKLERWPLEPRSAMPSQVGSQN